MEDQAVQSQELQQSEIWDAGVATKKIMWFVGKILAALLTLGFTSPKVQTLLTFAGVQWTPTEAQIIAATISGSIIEAIHDYLKVKTGWSWL